MHSWATLTVHIWEEARNHFNTICDFPGRLAEKTFYRELLEGLITFLADIMGQTTSANTKQAIGSLEKSLQDKATQIVTQKVELGFFSWITKFSFCSSNNDYTEREELANQMEQDTDLLEFENLSLPERALDRVVQNSMKNDPAGIYLLVAPSGAGKTYAIKRSIRARTIAGTAPGGLQISFFRGHLITSYAIDYVPDNTILFATWLDQRVFSQNDLSSVQSLLDIAKKAVSDRGMRFYIATSNVMLARQIMIYAPTTKLLCSGEDIANLKMTDTEASTLVSSAGGQHPEWTPLSDDQRSLLLTYAAIAGTPEFIFSSMQDLSARTSTAGKIDYLNGVAKAQATFISSQWDACIEATKDKKFQAIAKI